MVNLFYSAINPTEYPLMGFSWRESHIKEYQGIYSFEFALCGK